MTGVLAASLILVSGVGLGLSVHVWRVMRRQGSCAGSGRCDIVFAHPSARLLGFPNAVLAAAYFAAMIIFVGVREQVGGGVPLWPALCASLASLAMCVWMARILFFQLRRSCRL